MQKPIVRPRAGIRGEGAQGAANPRCHPGAACNTVQQSCSIPGADILVSSALRGGPWGKKRPRAGCSQAKGLGTALPSSFLPASPPPHPSASPRTLVVSMARGLGTFPDRREDLLIFFAAGSTRPAHTLGKHLHRGRTGSLLCLKFPESRNHLLWGGQAC